MIHHTGSASSQQAEVEGKVVELGTDSGRAFEVESTVALLVVSPSFAVESATACRSRSCFHWHPFATFLHSSRNTAVQVDFAHHP